MWVRTLRTVASIGPAGTLKDIDRPSAKALMVLGFVEAAEKPRPVLPEPKPKRVYKRKDMVAEVAPVVVEPEPILDSEPDSGE
jgi:hypothetical protein